MRLQPQWLLSSRLLSALLFALFLCLALLIPGGPIEHRDFSHLSPLVVWTFNTFLTILGFATLLLGFFVLRRQRWAVIGSIIAAFLFLVTDLLDLLQIFPTSPTSPDPLLRSFLFLILALSLGVLLLSLLQLPHASALAALLPPPRLHKRQKLLLMLILALLALAAIVYASHAILQ